MLKPEPEEEQLETFFFFPKVTKDMASDVIMSPNFEEHQNLSSVLEGKMGDSPKYEKQKAFWGATKDILAATFR